MPIFVHDYYFNHDMANFFKTLFSGSGEESPEEKARKDFDVLKYDGIKALKIGKGAYAIRCFNEALKIEQDAEVLEHLVAAYTREDRTEEAVETAGQLLDIEPENGGVLLLRANLNYMIERYADVIADCERAIAIDATDARAHYLAGRAKHKNGDAIGAIVSLSNAIARKEDYAAAYLLRAEVMLATGDAADGLQDADKAAELMPEEEQAFLIRGQLHEALRDDRAAEEDYRHAMEVNPFNEQAYLLLGNLHIARNQPAEAIALFDEAVELKPDFARAYHERGRARLLAGDKEGAATDLKKALELDAERGEHLPVDGTYSNFEDMYKNRPL